MTDLYIEEMKKNLKATTDYYNKMVEEITKPHLPPYDKGGLWAIACFEAARSGKHDEIAWADNFIEEFNKRYN